jgi:hypothetical protein
MSAPSEPNLRLVKASRDLKTDAGDSAQSAPNDARDAHASAETSALGQESVATGEIRNDWMLDPGDSAPSGTLLGVPGFPAAPRPKIVLDRNNLFVTPETVAAIEQVKRPTDPTLKVLVDADEKVEKLDMIDGVPLARLDQHSTQRPETAPATPYKSFEELGLPPHKITRKFQKVMVSTYRLIGFGVLSLVVFVLLGYIATTAFYFLNRTWITPVALTANDEKVVAMQGQLAERLNTRAQLVAEFEQSERAIAAEQAFQMQFARAIKRDLEGRQLALKSVQKLAHDAAATREEIRTTNGDYSASTVARMENEYKAGLIDRNSMLTGKYQLAQISSANLSLAERQAEFDQRAAELASETQSLDAILADKSHQAALSYDVLKIARDYETSKLALAREMSDHERLKGSIERQDQIIDGMRQAAYLRALDDHATVALVPYSHLKNVEKGTTLYGCALDMLVCHAVGKVLDILPGEVMVKVPNRDSMVRGRMIEMQLTDQEAAQNEVLFAGHAPLGI